MSFGLQRSELESLRDEFAELIRREPVCDLDTVFDAPARQRCGRMISRMAADARRAARLANRTH